MAEQKIREVSEDHQKFIEQFFNEINNFGDSEKIEIIDEILTHFGTCLDGKANEACNNLTNFNKLINKKV